MEKVSNKDIQRLRTMSFFIEAANKIIDTEGIEAVTVRKVANMAGYNQATVYNYFDNIDYLVGFAAIKYLTEYHKSLKKEVEPIKEPKERFLKIWEKFCEYSFKRPKIYRAIFFKTPKYTVCDLFDYYFKMFPEELENHSLDIQSMMRGCTIETRNMSILMDLYKEGIIKTDKEGLNLLNEMMIYIYQGMLYSIIDNEVTDEEEIKKYLNKCTSYIEVLMSKYQ